MVREFERLDRNIRRLRIRRRTLVSAVRIVCWWEKCGQLYAYEVDEACRRSEAVAKFAQAAKAVADGALAEWAGRPELERTLAAIGFSAAAAAARARKVYYDRAEYTKEWRLRRQGKDGE